ESGFEELFRSHEVAHQWWGISVNPSSYHDWWLAEAFAEYSGLMYMQAVLKDKEKFFGWLRDYRGHIMKDHTGLFSRGQQAGPIWLGYRNSTSTTEGDYQVLIYEKGAWVLHMLRNMLIDPNTLSEEKFRRMMTDFYQSYAYKYASTEDFQRVVEKHVGMKMDWFFQQWVYGTTVPTYSFSYTATQTPEGKYLLKCRVESENVADDFKSYPFIKIDFGDGQFSR